LEQRMPQAIVANEFVLHFQPKIRLSDSCIVGFEALIRWQHPEHGLVYPDDFIGLAETSNQIGALGDWVITAACLQLVQWRAEGLSLLPIAINVSARQLRDLTLPKRILRILAAHAIEPHLLQVELTESMVVENLEMVGIIMSDLVAAGVTIALDDYGSGFSGLSYLKSLPISTLKIDRNFIRDIRNSPHDSIIVESTIILAHNLGLHVVAEGVETRDQLVHLKTAGCDEVQGYYCSRPVPAEHARTMVLNPTWTPT